MNITSRNHFDRRFSYKQVTRRVNQSHGNDLVIGTSYRLAVCGGKSARLTIVTVTTSGYLYAPPVPISTKVPTISPATGLANAMNRVCEFTAPKFAKYPALVHSTAIGELLWRTTTDPGVRTNHRPRLLVSVQNAPRTGCPAQVVFTTML